MKSDFMVAINQVCHERQLPVEVVLEAVEVALVSAYKRNYGANSIKAKVDSNTGSVKIFVEKMVVEAVEDAKNEISLPDAKTIDADAEYDSVVQVESTPANFGRIAAQTTKQVILQRIREAERDALYTTYAEREGEVVHGTVHKVDHHQVILTLGQVEAVLPRTEQIPTECYVEGQRLRAFVSEVTKTPRGPLINVSRTHRSMLKRLLEVEVPEIYNGTVEIKAIAREAGHRSKIAVAALQEGVDPVGSCVGMRGVRIQSIVNELGGEKIDVAEWSPDTKIFIANALSPAKVLNVILQDITGDKTALVVVPDKQLSLAIGKEGQNARLAAKLTGWRIDIKSAMEAARDALNRASASDQIKQLVSDRPEVFSLVSSILTEKEGSIELSHGELQLLSEAIELVEQARLQIEREQLAVEKANRAKEVAARDTTDLLAEAEAILAEASTNLSEEDLDYLAEEDDIGDDPDDLLEAAVASFLGDASEDIDDSLESEMSMAETSVEETSMELQIEQTEVEVSEKADEQTEADEVLIATGTQDSEPELVEPIPSILESALSEPPQIVAAEPLQIKSILDEEETKPEKPVKKTDSKKRLKTVVVNDEEIEETPRRKGKTKSRTLEYDEALGQVVVKRHRKRSRGRDKWNDYYDDDLDD